MLGNSSARQTVQAFTSYNKLRNTRTGSMHRFKISIHFLLHIKTLGFRLLLIRLKRESFNFFNKPSHLFSMEQKVDIP